MQPSWKSGSLTGIQKKQCTLRRQPTTGELGFGESGKELQPTGNASADELKQYGTYYIGSEQEKVIYLTFDCGYENGNTEAILDALGNTMHRLLFCGGTFSGKCAGNGQKNGRRRAYRWKPYLSSPGYVRHF